MKIPNQTENAAMAIALYLAGIRPFHETDGFAMVYYDEQVLQNLGCKTIKEAMQKDLPGLRVFSFAQEDGELMDALKAVWDQEKELIERNQPSEVEVSPHDMVRIVARVLHCRKQIVKDWQQLPIYVQFASGPPEVVREDEDEKVISVPGFKMVNIRASQAILDRLELGHIVGLEKKEEAE